MCVATRRSEVPGCTSTDPRTSVCPLRVRWAPGLISRYLLKSVRQGRQSSLLAGHEAAIGIVDPGPIGREEDAVQSQASLKLDLLWRWVPEAAAEAAR